MTKAMKTTAAAPKYLNRHLFSDVQPYEVVRVISDVTVEIRAMKAELDPNWKVESVPGGFCRVVVNQDAQKWIITPDLDGEVVRARLTKSGRWSVKGEARYLAADRPVKFYDFNF